MKKKTQDNVSESQEAEVAVVAAPSEVNHDFGRTDLNDLRDAVNWLLKEKR